MAFDTSKLNKKVQEASAKTASAGYEPLKSGIYPAKIKMVGTYENGFGSDTFICVVEIEKEGSNEPVSLKIERGLTLKDGNDNKGTYSLIKEVLSATGVELGPDSIGKGVTKAWSKKDSKMDDFAVDTFVSCQEKTISAFVREVFEEGAHFERSNNIEDIFKLDRTNSEGKDQSETFLEKIGKEPIQKKKSKKKAATSGTGGTAASPSASAEGKL